jgi:hypothetical protein
MKSRKFLATTMTCLSLYQLFNFSPAVAAGNRNSDSYKSSFTLMKQLWASSSTPFSKSQINKYGGINGYCSFFEAAAENSSHVSLSSQKKQDFVLACGDFLRSKLK